MCGIWWHTTIPILFCSSNAGVTHILLKYLLLQFLNKLVGEIGCYYLPTLVSSLCVLISKARYSCKARTTQLPHCVWSVRHFYAPCISIETRPSVILRRCWPLWMKKSNTTPLEYHVEPSWTWMTHSFSSATFFIFNDR